MKDRSLCCATSAAIMLKMVELKGDDACPSLWYGDVHDARTANLDVGTFGNDDEGI